MRGFEIPFHIQEEIMKWLPVKSLLQFRSVSKAWKSFIDSSQFVTAHSHHRHTLPHHLLVSYEDPEIVGLNYICFVDDETLFQQRPVPTYPLSPKNLEDADIVGISHGLVCLYCPIMYLVCLWNPSIKKMKTIPVDVDIPRKSVFGFGVCPVTADPKIVSVTQKKNIKSSYRCKVMVYTLSSGEWRSLSTNLPTKPLEDSSHVVATDSGFIYWLGGFPGHNLIISFDVTNESFGVIQLPTTLARHHVSQLDAYKVKGCFGIIQRNPGTHTHRDTVWRMEDGFVTQLFTILFAPDDSVKGFRKSGVPLAEVDHELLVYEPNSQHNTNVLQIPKDHGFFIVRSYMETLLLHARSDCTKY